MERIIHTSYLRESMLGYHTTLKSARVGIFLNMFRLNSYLKYAQQLYGTNQILVCSSLHICSHICLYG